MLPPYSLHSQGDNIFCWGEHFCPAVSILNIVELTKLLVLFFRTKKKLVKNDVAVLEGVGTMTKTNCLTWRTTPSPSAPPMLEGTKNFTARTRKSSSKHGKIKCSDTQGSENRIQRRSEYRTFNHWASE